jgi:hypothetical protein
VIAWIALGVSIGALALSGYQWISGRRRNRILGDPEVVRAAVVNARDRFQEIISLGGEDGDFFLRDAHRLIGQALRDASARRPDKRLNELLESIAQQWDKAFGHAPAPRGPRVFFLGTGPSPQEVAEDLQRNRHRDLEVEAARVGQSFCAEALVRLNRLEQKL